MTCYFCASLSFVPTHQAHHYRYACKARYYYKLHFARRCHVHIGLSSRPFSSLSKVGLQINQQANAWKGVKSSSLPVEPVIGLHKQFWRSLRCRSFATIQVNYLNLCYQQDILTAIVFAIKGNKLNVSLWPVNPVGLLELIVRFLSLCCHSEI